MLINLIFKSFFFFFLRNCWQVNDEESSRGGRWSGFPLKRDCAVMGERFLSCFVFTTRIFSFSLPFYVPPLSCSVTCAPKLVSSVTYGWSLITCYIIQFPLLHIFVLPLLYVPLHWSIDIFPSCASSLSASEGTDSGAGRESRSCS